MEGKGLTAVPRRLPVGCVVTRPGLDGLPHVLAAIRISLGRESMTFAAISFLHRAFIGGCAR
jgi:hypothetical protein